MAIHSPSLWESRSDLPGMAADESTLTAGAKIEPGRQYGFFTDTTLCIGCKACEVARKEWNVLPADNLTLTGMSYDNTGSLSANTWRHVAFIEKVRGDASSTAMLMPPFQSHWKMMSDVCKHCDNAPCQEACPTGALFRTEFDTVVVQQDICNGCGYCVPACPFGVIDLNAFDGKAHKCTLCYDRLKAGLEPACAKACPTNSIQFGELPDLHRRAHQRVRRSSAADQRRLRDRKAAPG
jgi:formate dehydrogenase iron-sulfur subunit